MCKKLDFPFLSLGGPRHGVRVWYLGRVPKHRNQWQEVEGLLFSPQISQSVHIFELSFLGCGFVIHLSNRSDSPRFRAPWKKICQKYGTQQEPPLFRGHPLSCQYGDALCGFLIRLSNRSDSPRFRAPWKKIHQKYMTQQEPSLFKVHPLSY